MAQGRKTGARRGRQAAAESKTKGAEAPGKPVRSHKRWALEWLQTILVAVLLFLVIRTFLLQTFTITSGSMERTLLVGDFLVISKAAYGSAVPFTRGRIPGYEEPERGDIIVFRGPHEPDLDVVKRLIGLPGDTLEMRARKLYINGQPYPEPYVVDDLASPDLFDARMLWQLQHLAPAADRGDYQPTLHNWGPVVIPPRKYFMMGDHRDDSLDSRYWGLADRDRLRGRALVIYFSYDPESFRPFPWIAAMRPRRVGDIIR